MRSGDAQSDTYQFTLADRRVKEVANRYYNPPKSGNEPVEPLIDYVDGESFSFFYPDPRQLKTPLDEKSEIIEEDRWTRMDFTSHHHLQIWRYENEARLQAKHRADHYLP